RANTTFPFQTLDMATEEREHSMEMQLPFIAYLIERLAIQDETRWPKLVPIMVDCDNKDQQIALAKVLAPYVEDQTNVFVISSDFQHWGARFGQNTYVQEVPDLRGQVYPEEGTSSLHKQLYVDATRRS